MLRWRLLLGVVFVAALVALLWLDATAVRPGILLLPLAIVLTIVGTEELLGLMAERELRPLSPLVYAGNLLIVLSSYAGWWWPQPLANLGWPMAAFGLTIVATFFGEMKRYESPGRAIESLGATLLAICYIGVLFSFVVLLRFVGPDGRWGIAALASLVVVVKMGDTGAYTVGRLIGRRKLTPKLSPGKTIEGSLGGLVFSIAGALACGALLAPAISGTAYGLSGDMAWRWIAYGTIVGIAGMLGDLAESLLKRDVGRKDSSTWMPGFGGVLDLLDSILLAAPVAYLLWIFGVVRL